MKTFVKICGITTVEDAKTAASLGSDFIGVILEIEYSPRSVSIETANSIIDFSSAPVILLLEKPCNEIQDIASDIKPWGVQIVGKYPFSDIKRLKNTTECAVWKTVHIPKENGEKIPSADLKNIIEKYHGAGIDVVVLDTMAGKKKGGTGQVCDWGTARELVESSPVPVFLAGGITPANAREAINQVKPYGIDLSSGVEKSPGRKDPEKISELMRNIKI
jgi:phosphoribosylanthranilate isomerase